MSTNNVGPWICDTCGEDIVDPLGGLVIWQTEGAMAQNFRVVHKGKCDWNDTHKMSLEIESFIGPDGLALLLSWLSYGPVRPCDNGDRVANKDEYVVLVRRMQTPGYERARQYF